MKYLMILSLLIFTFEDGKANFFTNFEVVRLPIPANSGSPLFLTPLIESGDIEEARNQSQVIYNDFPNIVSYSGYFTVDKVFDNNLFFWFFASEDNFFNDPIILWLEGGPGIPSEYGLFAEHGPFIVDADYNISLRDYRWTRNHSVLYIDSPVGTGFSFTTKEGYAKNQTRVAKDLYNGMLQFFTLFSELQKNDFFVVGESYGGKYVPALSYTILQNNPSASLKINLKGLAIGNGLSDPINQADYGDYLYQIGLVDAKTRDALFYYKSLAEKYITEGNWTLATKYFYTEMKALILNASNIESIYNYIQTFPDPPDYWQYFIQDKLRDILHVGDIEFNSGTVFQDLYDDIAKSVAPWVSELLSYYPVLLYNGQVDVIVAYPLTLNYLQKLNFSAAEEYKDAKRHIWTDSEGVAGYYKTAGNLTEVLVRNAGHMVPIEQPRRAYNLIYNFIRNIPLQEQS